MILSFVSIQRKAQVAFFYRCSDLIMPSFFAAMIRVVSHEVYNGGSVGLTRLTAGRHHVFYYEWKYGFWLGIANHIRRIVPPVCAERAGASACFYIDEKAKESSETFYSLTRIILWEVHSGQTSGMHEGINSQIFSVTFQRKHKKQRLPRKISERKLKRRLKKTAVGKRENSRPLEQKAYSSTGIQLTYHFLLSFIIKVKGFWNTITYWLVWL